MAKNNIQSESNEESKIHVKRDEKFKHNKNRKRKRNKFLQNVKSFGKKGNYGHGTQIEDVQFNYFSNILNSLNDCDSLDDKTSMANNVLEQTKGKELHLCSNQVVSKVIEALIGFTDEEIFERFINAFTEELRPMCSDRFASHVLQKMIEISFLRIGSVESNKKEDDDPPPKKKTFPISTEKIFNLKEKFSESHVKKCETFFLTISKFLLNNLEDFYLDSYANHLIRSVLLALAGLYGPKIVQSLGNKKHDTRPNLIVSNEQLIKNPKPDWQEILEEYAKRLQLWPQFPDLPYHKLSAGLLANLYFAISHTNKEFLNKFGIKILTECLNIVVVPEIKEEKTEDSKEDIEKMESPDSGKDKDDENEEDKDDDKDDDKKDDGKDDDKKDDDKDDDKKDNDKKDNKKGKKKKNKLFAKDYPKVFHHESSCCLLETMLLNCEYKFLSKCYAKIFRDNIVDLAKLQLSNFAVQKLIDKIEISEFDEVFDPLCEKIVDLLKCGHTGVVYSMGNACLRLQTKQGAFIKALNTALKGNSDDTENSADFLVAVLKLKPMKIAKTDNSNFIHLHGSLIVQTILKFNKPIQMINSILSQSAEKLNSIFQTTLGSYCVDAFFDSNYVGEKSKEKLIKLFEGNYLSLATDKFGSRIVEVFFKNASNGQKEKIVKELSSRINQLKSSIFGRFLHRNLNVDAYKMSPAAWKAGLGQLKL